jgi:hypothetical protein
MWKRMPGGSPTLQKNVWTGYRVLVYTKRIGIGF